MKKNDIHDMSELYNSLRYADRKGKADVDYLNLKHYDAFYNQKTPGTYESKKISVIFLEEIKNDFKLILKKARRIQLTIFDYYQTQQK